MLKSKMRSDDRREMVTEINVTPLVDVCLVLVIIFMVTTAMFFQILIKDKIQHSRHKLVVSRADEKAQSGAVIDTLNLIKQAGARRITFGTDSKAE